MLQILSPDIDGRLDFIDSTGFRRSVKTGHSLMTRGVLLRV